MILVKVSAPGMSPDGALEAGGGTYGPFDSRRHAAFVLKDHGWHDHTEGQVGTFKKVWAGRTLEATVFDEYLLPIVNLP